MGSDINAVVPTTQTVQQSNALVTAIPTTQELMVYQTWAKNAYDSQMYRNVGKESAIMMIMLAAREYGIGPAQALNGGLHIIEGKVELSARMMSALIRKAKHILKIIESTDQKCVITGKRSDTGEEHTVEYTIDMAQKAGLVKDKGGWKKNPEDMLYARAVSRLARQLFSDVVGIGYVEGEIRDCSASCEVLEHVPEVASIESMHVQFFSLFGEENKQLAFRFLHELCEHFKKDEYQILKACLDKAEETIEKFNTWKEKL